mmetsp:Transcript_74611/g.216469  ORF Transcript_74611/g.216469 Transcript_74611/m.216469 type:complete len:214 (+) Transcript_74611:196-837(+)
MIWSSKPRPLGICEKIPTVKASCCFGVILAVAALSCTAISPSARRLCTCELFGALSGKRPWSKAGHTWSWANDAVLLELDAWNHHRKNCAKAGGSSSPPVDPTISATRPSTKALKTPDCAKTSRRQIDGQVCNADASAPSATSRSCIARNSKAMPIMWTLAPSLPLVALSLTGQPPSTSATRPERPAAQSVEQISTRRRTAGAWRYDLATNTS